MRKVKRKPQPRTVKQIRATNRNHLLQCLAACEAAVVSLRKQELGVELTEHYVLKELSRANLARRTELTQKWSKDNA